MRNFGGTQSCTNVYIAALLFLFAPAFAQAPDTLWTRTYGGSGNDVGYSVHPTEDGGYIIAGMTTSFGAGGSDVYLVKTDSHGDTIWTKTCGGGGNDFGWAIAQIANGNYVIAGYTNSFGAGECDFYLVKTDSLGDTIWTKTYGGASDEKCYSMQQTADGGFIMAGFTVSFGAGSGDAWLVKTDGNGDTLWTKTYGGSDVDYIVSTQQTNDAGYILAGGTKSYGAGDVDVYLVKTDSLGDTLWTKTYGGIDYDRGHSVQQTSDCGYIVSGTTCSNGALGADLYLLRTNNNGDTLWTRFWGGTANEWGYSVAQDLRGEYIVAGKDENDHASQGPAHYDVWLLRVGESGDTVWSVRYGDTLHDEHAEAFLITPNNSYVLVGFKALHNWTIGDLYMIKTTSDEAVEEKNNSVTKPTYGQTIFSGALQLPEGKTCRVFDITGRVVTPDKMRPGIYFIEVDGRIAQKVVKVR